MHGLGLVAVSGGCLFVVAVCRLPVEVASLVAEDRLLKLRLTGLVVVA